MGSASLAFSSIFIDSPLVACSQPRAVIHQRRAAQGLTQATQPPLNFHSTSTRLPEPTPVSIPAAPDRPVVGAVPGIRCARRCGPVVLRPRVVGSPRGSQHIRPVNSLSPAIQRSIIVILHGSNKSTPAVPRLSPVARDSTHPHGALASVRALQRPTERFSLLVQPCQPPHTSISV